MAFTQDYLNTFERTLNTYQYSADVIREMRQVYPTIADESVLE